MPKKPASSTEPKEGDTVRIALGRDRWKLKKILRIGGDIYGELEKPDGKGRQTNYVKLHSLVKVEE